MPKKIAPYGSWPSPITSSLLTSSGVSLSQIAVTTEGIYWAEGRPLEGGRVVIVRDSVDVTPPGFNVRTKAHEYGGGAYAVHGSVVYFSNFVDQRIYRQDHDSVPRPITPEPPSSGSLRYADARLSPNGETIVCVRERHEPGAEAINELVLLSATGAHDAKIIASGHDFFSSPRFNADGTSLLWLSWDHPNMPWDGTELSVANIGHGHRLENVRKIAGGPSESIFQPEWGDDGSIYFVSDRTGWWNLYSSTKPLAPMEAEFGAAQWIFGMSHYALLSGNRLACIYSQAGLDCLAILDTVTGALNNLELPYTSYSDLRTDGDNVLFVIAASAKIPAQIVRVDVRDGSRAVLKSSMTVALDPQDLSTPEPIEYPTKNGRSSHALYYPAASRTSRGPSDEKPPLLVISHGGPTSATTSSFRLPLQYWTSRGFAVVDVNYGGSTGYGREYRERLNGNWGIVDVEDCIEAARYLAARGDIDPERMAIRGGSAGGYTTLCALVFHDAFAAGASYYGVADLAALAEDTHKFESRYTDRLVAPYSGNADLYRERSPLYFADRISCPVILFQGLEDKVVLPNQAETFASALRGKKLPFAYVSFPTEGHGFRQAESIQRAAEAELYFYSRIFEFELSDPVQPLEIEGL